MTDNQIKPARFRGISLMPDDFAVLASKRETWAKKHGTDISMPKFVLMLANKFKD